MLYVRSCWLCLWAYVYGTYVCWDLKFQCGRTAGVRPWFAAINACLRAVAKALQQQLHITIVLTAALTIDLNGRCAEDK